MYASGTAINREVKRICAARGGDPDRMDAKIAAGLARSGDPEYQQVYRNAGTALGRGIAVLLQLMDLERVILGGSVTASFDLMRDAVAETVNQGSYWGADPDRWLKMAALQPDSGLYGAAALAAAKTEQEES